MVAVLTAQVASLQDKTCNCKEGPKLVGQGTADVPFKLEYADEVVLPSPNPSSYATPPIENAVPVPTPAPASTLAESDKENCRRCPLQQIGQLVKIEDVVIVRPTRPLQFNSTLAIQTYHFRDQTHSYNPVANPGISEVSSQTRLEEGR